MSESSGDSSKPIAAVSKLGRGLGRLIPVQKPGEQSASRAAVNPSVSTSMIEPPKAPAAVTLVSDSPVPVITAPAESAFGRLVMQLPIVAIQPNARQPRKEFDESSIQELSNSIRSAGLLQPIVVRPVIGQKSKYEIIAGERRWRACKKIGWNEIPAIVMNATDQNAGIWALIENVHRADLNAMDRAASLKQLASEFKLTHEALAEQVGLDRSSVSNLLRLADLDPTTAALVRKGLLSQGHAKALLAVSDLKTRSTLAESSVRGDWSVRALEREVQRLSEASAAVPRGTTASRRRTNIDALERKLSQALGTDVSIQTGRKPNTGKLNIAFYSIEQFEGLVASLGVKPGQMQLED